MKSRSVIIFILITSLLSPACATRNEYAKTNIPKDSFNEVIKEELALNNEIIEVKVKNRLAPIRVIGIENDDVLVGVNNDGQEVKVTIKEIEKAWTRDSLPDSNSYTETINDCKDNPLCHFIGKILIILILFAVLV